MHFFPPVEAHTKSLVNDECLPDLLKGGNFQFSPCAVSEFSAEGSFFLPSDTNTFQDGWSCFSLRADRRFSNRGNEGDV